MMCRMKFSALKSRVKRAARDACRRYALAPDTVGHALAAAYDLVMTTQNGGSPCQALVDEMARRADEVIDRWDVRCVSSLVELAPDAVPTWVRAGRFTVDLDDAGWWLVRTEKEIAR